MMLYHQKTKVGSAMETKIWEYGKQTVQLKDQHGLYQSCFDCLAQTKVKG